jgi:hypothetical protein
VAQSGIVDERSRPAGRQDHHPARGRPPALGKTPTQLQRDMEKALVKYIRDPVVTVVVTSSLAGPANEQIRDRRGDQAPGAAVSGAR